jgi:hypothetical protein
VQHLSPRPLLADRTILGSYCCCQIRWQPPGDTPWSTCVNHQQRPNPLAAPPPWGGTLVNLCQPPLLLGCCMVLALAPSSLYTPPPSSFSRHQLHPLSLAVQHLHGSSRSMPGLSNSYGAALVLLYPADLPQTVLASSRRHCLSAPVVVVCKALYRTAARWQAGSMRGAAWRAAAAVCNSRLNMNRYLPALILSMSDMPLA